MRPKWHHFELDSKRFVIFFLQVKPLKILDAKNIVAFRREHLKTKIPGETTGIPDFFTSETPRGREGGGSCIFKSNVPFYGWSFSFALPCNPTWKRGTIISGWNYKIARNCLPNMLYCIATQMKMRNANCVKGYSVHQFFWCTVLNPDNPRKAY